MDNEKQEMQTQSPVSVALRLYRSLLLDVWPTPAAITDFGIESPDHYAALQWVVKGNLVSEDDLQRACGKGDALTKLVDVADNPYRDVIFHTLWDNFPTEDSEPQP